ncbi:MAG: glutamate-1-semialdehyde 2,1-aminomutase [Deltaproteobacteria bacterium]|nr:glutamate-1-semialdehyde 2,1-aminomutase [Deltaproteobacteria bacterium]
MSFDPEEKFKKTRELQQKSHRLIPGGGHTYAKGDDQYPVLAPGFIVRGQGAHVWDPDGNEYIEYGMGLRAVTLGHGYAPVVAAAYREMAQGTNFTRPSPLEVECAEALLDLIEPAEMVKFAKNGSDVTTAALKLARAFTGRDLVAICAEQPFFSTDDWFIGSTPMDAGIPDSTKALTVKFHYNDLESVKRLFAEYPGRIAGLIMEAATALEPAERFPQEVQRLCRENGALFILDEMITGFRWHLGGAQAYYQLQPDLSAFGKALANGFSVSALVGRRAIMELGGLQHGRERVFLLSTTHGAETPGLAACLKTMEIYREQQVIETLWRQGEVLQQGLNQISASLGLSEHFWVIGRPCNLVYLTRDQEGAPSQSFRALFLQETIKRGILAPSLVVSFSHTEEDLRKTLEAVEGALQVFKRALADGVDQHLVGRPVKPVFRKYN